MVTIGDTVMSAAVAPLLHKYVPPPEAESVEVLPAVIVTLLNAVATGTGFTTTSALAVAVQVPMETVTEYVEWVVGETVMIEFVFPSFQE